MKRSVYLILLLAVVYFTTARLGLLMDAVSGFATLVWPPTGIALAALLVWGFRLWPGILLGAFFTNWSTGAPVLVALGMGAGNTAEALVGVYLLSKVGKFDKELARVRDVLALVVLAALASTSISATIGVGSLWLGGPVSASTFVPTWKAWWIGDVLGDLVVAPLLLLIVTRQRPRRRRRYFPEVALLACALIGFNLLVFGRAAPRGQQPLLQQVYFLFPLLIWAALRFGLYGSVIGTFFVSVMAIAGTALGRGPFVAGSLSEGLLSLQAFMGVVAVTALVLSAAVTERNRAIEVRDDFLSIAAHELRTPLTSLQLQVQSMLHRHETAGGTPGDDVKKLAMAERQTRRLAMLIEELLDVSRLRTGQFRLALGQVDLCQVVRDAASRFELDASRTGSTLSVDLPDSVLGTWDPLRLEQLVSNLVGNAVKYGLGKPIEIVVAQAGEGVVFTVRDHGPGIAPDVRRRLFEKFERAQVDRQIRGLGLGLYIARQIVLAHGGTISVESETGRGSTFTVELPRSSSSPRTQSQTLTHRVT